MKTLRWLLDLSREFMLDLETSSEHATGVTHPRLGIII